MEVSVGVDEYNKCFESDVLVESLITKCARDVLIFQNRSTDCLSFDCSRIRLMMINGGNIVRVVLTAVKEDLGTRHILTVPNL